MPILGNVRVEDLSSPNGQTARESGPSFSAGPVVETYAARLEQAGPWRTNGAIPASQAATSLTLGAIDATAQTGFPFFADASIVAVILRPILALTAGTLTLTLRIGSTTIFTQALTSFTGAPIILRLPAPVNISSGQEIGVRLQTDSGYLPTTNSYTAFVVYRWTA